jgi:hypothetical protein
MELTDSQKQALRQMYLSKGDALESLMVSRMMDRGVDEESAHRAARECSNRIWRNSMASGAFAGVILGTIFTPVVGGVAGSSVGVVVGWHTLIQSNACAEVRDFDFQGSLREVQLGF